MPTAEIDGYTYAYLEEGQGPPVVFAHGLLADKEMFRAQIDSLKARYRCISIDLRGHGASSGPAEPFTLEQQAEEVGKLIRSLGIERAACIGLSQGAMTFMRLALSDPDLVGALVLIDTSADVENPESLPQYQELAVALRDLPDDERQGVVDVVQAILYGQTWREQIATPDQLEHEARIMLGHDRHAFYQSAQAVFDREDLRTELAAISCPVLVVVGEEDVATPPEKAEEIRDAIPGAKLVRIKQAGHHCPIEQPEQVTDALDAFLAEHAP